jgi:hypothetical protein
MDTTLTTISFIGLRPTVWNAAEMHRLSVGPLRRGFDPRKCHVSIDANALDRTVERAKLVDRLLALHDSGCIKLIIPKGVRVELSNPRTPLDVRTATEGKIFTINVGLNASELAQKRQLTLALRGNANSNKHAPDADHLFEATKYGGYFITEDKRILKKAGGFKLSSSLQVVTLTEFLKIYDMFALSRVQV